MSYRIAPLAGILFSTAALAQHLVVTVEGHHGSPAPQLQKDDISVEVNRKPARVESWTALRGDQGGLELYVVIDDGEDSDLSLQFPSLKSFIEAQPASTRVGLAYLRNGAANIVVQPTADHAAVSKAFRLPTAQPGIAASPYMGVTDLVKKWPAADARREVLLITSGIDPWSSPDPQNPYLREAITRAQGAGILVHSIYYGGAGHAGHSYWQVNWGQNYLSELGDETGGEAYAQGLSSPVSFDPFLKDLGARLQNQYLLTIDAGAAKDDLQPVRLTSSRAGVSVTSASRVHIAK